MITSFVVLFEQKVMIQSWSLWDAIFGFYYESFLSLALLCFWPAHQINLIAHLLYQATFQYATVNPNQFLCEQRRERTYAHWLLFSWDVLKSEWFFIQKQPVFFTLLISHPCNWTVSIPKSKSPTMTNSPFFYKARKRLFQ